MTSKYHEHIDRTTLEHLLFLENKKNRNSIKVVFENNSQNKNKVLSHKKTTNLKVVIKESKNKNLLNEGVILTWLLRNFDFNPATGKFIPKAVAEYAEEIELANVIAGMTTLAKGSPLTDKNQIRAINKIFQMGLGTNTSSLSLDQVQRHFFKLEFPTLDFDQIKALAEQAESKKFADPNAILAPDEEMARAHFRAIGSIFSMDKNQIESSINFLRKQSGIKVPNLPIPAIPKEYKLLLNKWTETLDKILVIARTPIDPSVVQIFEDVSDLIFSKSLKTNEEILSAVYEKIIIQARGQDFFDNLMLSRAVKTNSSNITAAEKVSFLETVIKQDSEMAGMFNSMQQSISRIAAQRGIVVEQAVSWIKDAFQQTISFGSRYSAAQARGIQLNFIKWCVIHLVPILNHFFPLAKSRTDWFSNLAWNLSRRGIKWVKDKASDVKGETFTPTLAPPLFRLLAGTYLWSKIALGLSWVYVWIMTKLYDPEMQEQEKEEKKAGSSEYIEISDQLKSELLTRIVELSIQLAVLGSNSLARHLVTLADRSYGFITDRKYLSLQDQLALDKTRKFYKFMKIKRIKKVQNKCRAYMNSFDSDEKFRTSMKSIIARGDQLIEEIEDEDNVEDSTIEVYEKTLEITIQKYEKELGIQIPRDIEQESFFDSLKALPQKAVDKMSDEAKKADEEVKKRYDEMTRRAGLPTPPPAPEGPPESTPPSQPRRGQRR